MKPIFFLFATALLSLQVSCSKAVKFPVSNVAPAANITAEKTKDKNNNYQIKITAENLADANRLSPPKSTYVAWVVTENNGTQNIGQLEVKNAGKATLQALTPYDVKELFITAEDQAAVQFPAGIEVSRIRY